MQHQEAAPYGIGQQLDVPFEEASQRSTDTLRQEGLGAEVAKESVQSIAAEAKARLQRAVEAV